MKNIKLLAVSIACLGAATIYAQDAARSAYFLDGYSQRHQLNPAFLGERNYVSMPLLGNLGINTMANIGVNTFLYKLPDGQLTTFMNKQVSANEFLGNINSHNNLSFNTNMTLLEAGFKAFGGYNTITIGTRTDIGLSLPGGLFKFMKLGQTGEYTKYNFKDLTIEANAMAEAALGHAHRINDKITVGGKLKVLMGLGHAYAKIDRMDLVMSDNTWSVTAKGQLNLAAGSGLYVPTKAEAGKHYDNPGQADEIEWNDIDYKSFGLTGFGMGLDMGVTWQLLPDLQLSAAVRDLGFMHWSNAVRATTPDKAWSFDGFKEIALDSDMPGYEENKIGQQLDDMWDDLEDMINFRKTSDKGSRNTALAATVHLGAEYLMPFYKKLTAGALITSCFNGPFTWYEGRVSANVKPVKWFDATLNYALSSFGSSMGWMINFHPKGFNFFVGTDHQFFKITPQFVPVGNANFSFNMGINFTFGS